MNKKPIKLLARLFAIVGSLAYVIVIASLNGSLGFLTSMSITSLGALALAKYLGLEIAISYGGLFACIIVFGFMRGALAYAEQYSNHYIAFKLLATLRDKIFRNLRKLSPAKLDNKEKGSLISMITADIETLEVFYAHTISPTIIASVVSLTVLLILGFTVSWYLALVTMIAYIFIGIVNPIILSKKLSKIGYEYRTEFADFSSYYLESVRGIKEIVLNKKGDKRIEEVKNRSDKLGSETLKMNKHSIFAAVKSEACISIFMVLIAVVSILLYFKQGVHIGLVIFGIVTAFSSFGPVIALANLPSALTHTFASAERVINLIDEKPLVEEIVNGKEAEYKNIKLENLSFSYTNKDEDKVLNSVSMEIKQGQITGIMGQSGSGKSTLLKLLLRFWKVPNGMIKYDGIDINDINTNNLFSNVTMVSQSTYLFAGTIEDNLRIAKEDATEEEIIKACKSASVHDSILRLKDGYKTSTGQLGDALSSGEKQRIGLARAFLTNAKIILLDEPTSNVDSMSEAIILKSLIANKKDKAIVLVSHRESTMAIADNVYKIVNGKIEK